MKKAQAVAPEQKPTIEVRTRVRPVVEVEIPEAIKELARTVFNENKALNEAKRNHDGARKNLFAYMKQHSIAPFRFETTDAKKKAVILDVGVETPERSSISVELLRKLVPDEATFMKIIEATKTSVVAHVGDIIATQATVMTKGTENVVVKVAGDK